MALMLSKLYAALRDAGAEEAPAREAAEELAGYENRFAGLETNILLLKWMIGTNLALTIAVIGILLRGKV